MSLVDSHEPGGTAMRLVHGRLGVALHALSTGSELPDEGDLPLLLLHELGGRAADWPDLRAAWPGPIHALDFAGHGESDRVRGGGYYPEYFLADADLALGALGDRIAVAGAGVGAYVALLLAGARPDRVSAALLLAGRGLAGGGGDPTFEASENLGLDEVEERVEREARRYAPATDRFVSFCEHDLRPPDYAGAFAKAARHVCFAADADEQAGDADWWRRARAEARGELVSGELFASIETLRDHCG